MAGTKLAFINASLTMEQARKVLFDQLYSLFKVSPYFNRNFPFDPNIKSEIRFCRLTPTGPREDVICYPLAASEPAMMGYDVFSGAIDEVNFMQTVEKSRRTTPGGPDLYDQAEAVYNRLLVRMKTRWNQRGGRLPGLLWLISSARYPGDFTERKEKEAQEKNPLIFVRHYSLWDTKRLSDMSTKRFFVEVGDITRQSRVLPDEEKDWPAGVNRERLMLVPEDYRLPFERNPEQCVRDLAGISVQSIAPFIPRREAIRRMFELGKLAGMQPTFSRLEVTLQNPLPELERLLPQHLHYTDRQKQDKFGYPIFEDAQWTKPVMEKVLFPAMYYAHVDLSKNKCATGIVVGHAIGSKRVPRFDIQAGHDIYETMPIIRIDLALRVVAPPHGEIDVPRVRALLYQLRQLGMDFGLVTFDQFGSQECIKNLKDQGFNADNFSLETDLTAWDELKQALYDERLLCFECLHLEQELAQLELVKGKIEKPSYAGASKDIADCFAAVVHHVEEGWRKGYDSKGMFQLGYIDRPEPITQDSTYQNAITKVARGQPLELTEEEKILFQNMDRVELSGERRRTDTKSS
jgi:hypothetical protein